MPKMYYCSECKKRHKSGKIYKDHLQFKNHETKKYPSDKIQEVDFQLRSIARRQIGHYLEMIEYQPNWRGIYISKINQLIDYERNSSKSTTTI